MRRRRPRHNDVIIGRRCPAVGRRLAASVRRGWIWRQYLDVGDSRVPACCLVDYDVSSCGIPLMPRHRADTTAANCALEKEVSYLRLRNYSAPDRGARSIAISVSVCLSVCAFVCPRSYLRNYTSDFHHFFMDCETVGIPPLMSRKTLGILDGGRGGAVDRSWRRRGIRGVDKGGA